PAGAGGAEGAGLGLELCRALAAHAGGSLEMERRGPGGTSFLLRLPAAPVQDAVVGAPPERPRAGREKALPRGGGG
ncbi:MAG TPA: ATP-binding protein, partial [Longimicrobiaceae bacterium]|nr:ATP-binding protein [Longimicrobiaceae bacterium]